MKWYVYIVFIVMVNFVFMYDYFWREIGYVDILVFIVINFVVCDNGFFC